MSVQVPEEEIITVRNADGMDRETFCLHMTHRHPESLGGLRALLPEDQSPYTEELWRTFHDQLHGQILSIEPNHIHGRKR